MTFDHEVLSQVVDSGKDAMIPEPFVVQRIRRETVDTFTLELARNSRNGPFGFSPGQFNMVYMFGVGEVPISISGNPMDSRTLTHTTRAVGIVTGAMKKLKIGDTLGIRGPFGTSWPVDKAQGKDVVIIAGGIGLPPLRPAIYAILNDRKAYGNVSLLYGARTPEDIMFPKQLEEWRVKSGLEVLITVDRAKKGWKGNVGVVTTLIPKAHFDPQKTIAMIVGPEVMMRFSTMDLLKCGIDPSRIYISMERNMKCGIGQCGHCQYGQFFVCKDGPVFPYNTIKDLLLKREI